MALKDWKKTGVNKWKNKKTGDKVVVDYEEFAGKKDWILEITSMSGYDVETRREKSFSDAIRSAKQYMRTH